MRDAIASLAVLGLVATTLGCGSSSSGPSGSSGASGSAQSAGASGGTGGTATNAQGGQAGDRATGGATSGTGAGGSSGSSTGSVAGAGGNAGNAQGTGGSAASGGGDLNPYAGPGTMCFNGQCPAGQFCCEDVASDSGCIASATSCGCATPGSCIVLQCDEPADCQTGLCCATRAQSGVPIDEFSSVLCKPSCGVNDYQVCTKNSDCASGECGPSSRAGLFHCF
jgi:hypothetical protein